MDETLIDAATAAKLAGVEVDTIRVARQRGNLSPARIERKGRMNEYWYRTEDIRRIWPEQPKRDAESDEV